MNCMMMLVKTLVLILAATACTANSTKCKSSSECGEKECCVVYSGFSEKEFIRGYCEPLGGLGYFCVPHKPLNLTWTTETDEYHATNVYFKCPCEDSLVCTGTTGHCGPRTGPI